MSQRSLLLIPTAIESDRLRPHLSDTLDDTWRIELSGFGLVAAGVGATLAIARHRPQRVVLAGIAGSLNESIDVGDAAVFDRVVIDGIGVGEADQFETAAELGWGDAAGPAEYALTSASSSQATLVSVTAASSNAAMASRRSSRNQQRVDDVIAEDMEGYAVAMACDRANVPLTIIRGISNRAGDRRHADWQIQTALQSAADRFRQWQSENTTP